MKKNNARRPRLTLSSQTVRTLNPTELELVDAGCDTTSLTTENTHIRQEPNKAG
jgi:hypothetical protein